jgi:hypothetical protein
MDSGASSLYRTTKREKFGEYCIILSEVALYRKLSDLKLKTMKIFYSELGRFEGVSSRSSMCCSDAGVSSYIAKNHLIIKHL